MSRNKQLRLHSEKICSPGCSNLAWYLPLDWQISSLIFRAGWNSFAIKAGLKGTATLQGRIGADDSGFTKTAGLDVGAGVSSGLCEGGVDAIT